MTKEQACEAATALGRSFAQHPVAWGILADASHAGTLAEAINTAWETTLASDDDDWAQLLRPGERSELAYGSADGDGGMLTLREAREAWEQGLNAALERRED